MKVVFLRSYITYNIYNIVLEVLAKVIIKEREIEGI